jgi:hypothetical protein
MANEITLSAALNVTVNGTSLINGAFAKQLTRLGDEGLQGSVVAGNGAYSDLPLSTLDESAGAGGGIIALVKNNDATNNVLVAHYNSSTEQQFALLVPGEFLLVHLKWGASYALRVKAAAATCEVFFAATEA